MACSKPFLSAKEDEKNCKLTYFFLDLLKNRIDFQIPKNETKDIVLAIDILVHEILHRVMTNVDWLGKYECLRVLKVGSMAEGTSISFPDEFDYLIVTHQDGIEVETICKWREGYAHVKVTDDYLRSLWKPFLRGDYLQGSFSHDLKTGKLTSVVQYLSSVFRKWLRRDPLPDPDSRSIFTTYYDSLENALMSEVEKVISLDENITFVTKTGTLRVKKEVVNHGPAFMLAFIWTSNETKSKMSINVDMTLAIEVDMEKHRNVIKKEDTFHERIWETLVGHRQILLIPCNESTSCVAGLCFRISFTETEVKLVRSMSRHHKECYRLLKYIFNSGRGYSYLPSYVYKTLVIKHDCFCREESDLAVCFKMLVASLLHYMANSERKEKAEPSRLLRIFMPGQKMSLNIPSIFMKGHNILNGKDFIFTGEQFASSIEKMLNSLDTISNKYDPCEKDLKIVNGHDTAAQAYGTSLVPFRKNPVENCQDCLNDYFREYGGWASVTQDVDTEFAILEYLLYEDKTNSLFMSSNICIEV